MNKLFWIQEASCQQRTTKAINFPSCMQLIFCMCWPLGQLMTKLEVCPPVSNPQSLLFHHNNLSFIQISISSLEGHYDFTMICWCWGFSSHVQSWQILWITLHLEIKYLHPDVKVRQVLYGHLKWITRRQNLFW